MEECFSKSSQGVIYPLAIVTKDINSTLPDFETLFVGSTQIISFCMNQTN